MSWGQNSAQRKLQDVVKWGLVAFFAWRTAKQIYTVITKGGTVEAIDHEPAEPIDQRNPHTPPNFPTPANNYGAERE